MTKYDFDEVVDRRNSDCIKYDALGRFFGNSKLLPLWVADMDFKTPRFILEAIRQRTCHEVMGYTFRGDGYHEAIVNWVRQRHGWNVSREWISSTPGVVSALAVAVLAFTRPGDRVVVQPPVYFPFFEVVKGNGRRVAENPLRLENGRYGFDLDHLEQLIDKRTRMLLLCSPHNPGGMVWKEEELTALLEICSRHNLLVVSDEIHADLLFKGHTHHPWAMLPGEAAHHSIVCMAPSKTFNMAGLSTSFTLIPDPAIRKQFDRLAETLHIHTGNIAGAVALEAAYRQGEEWLEEMMAYVEDNYRFLEQTLALHLPLVKVMKPEATFLVWLDFRDYGRGDRELTGLLVNEAKVALNNGARFGTGGDGFQRINIGCPRSLLKEGLERIIKAFRKLER